LSIFYNGFLRGSSRQAMSNSQHCAAGTLSSKSQKGACGLQFKIFYSFFLFQKTFLVWFLCILLKRYLEYLSVSHWLMIQISRKIFNIYSFLFTWEYLKWSLWATLNKQSDHMRPAGCQFNMPGLDQWFSTFRALSPGWRPIFTLMSRSQLFR